MDHRPSRWHGHPTARGRPRAEFPRVDDRVVSRPHRYGYGAVIGEVIQAITATGDFPDNAFTNAILKHDLDHATVQAHEFGRDATAGDAVFARPRQAQPRTTAM